MFLPECGFEQGLGLARCERCGVLYTLPDGYVDLPAGKLANVVTCLEMLQKPELRAEPIAPSCTLRHVVNPALSWYRALFKAVGEPFLWFSRLSLSDEELARIVENPKVEVYVVLDGAEEAGMLELDFRTAHECEIVFFGVIEAMRDRGVGRWLMNRAIERAWSQPVTRLHLHTCTLDHPSAPAFYARTGFVPYKRQIEVYDDPRLHGLLARNAAPNVPIL